MFWQISCHHQSCADGKICISRVVLIEIYLFNYLYYYHTTDAVSFKKIIYFICKFKAPMEFYEQVLCSQQL
jgi:hypothetical protein